MDYRLPLASMVAAVLVLFCPAAAAAALREGRGGGARCKMREFG